MAVNDDLNPRNRMSDHRARTEGMGMLPLIIGLIGLALLGWWFFGNLATRTDGPARTTAPVTGSPNTGTNTTSNPTTTPKQP